MVDAQKKEGSFELFYFAYTFLNFSLTAALKNLYHTYQNMHIKKMNVLVWVVKTFLLAVFKLKIKL